MLWFFLNLLLLAAIFLILFNFRFAPSSFFRGTAYRIETVARLINEETNEKTRAERNEILKGYGELNRVEFFLFDNVGKQFGGREIELPTEVYKEITRPDSPPGARRKNPPPRGGPPPSIYLKTENPPLYWYGIKMMTYEGGSSEPVRTRLLAASDSFFGYGLFFDPTAWLIAAAIVVIVSLLFWLPFVRGITRNIAQMTDATEQIAEEKFDVRVGDKRTDEIGRLGAAINQLASRLSGFVSGQKRFLGDISHELNSPLARMQFALSILEDRVDGKNRGYVVDAKEEVELMSKLVGELLEYSKAGIKTTEVNLVKIRLRPLVETVIEREKATETAEVKIIIADNIEVLAQPELLSRAIANVVRNAVCYAGKAGEIKVSATNGKNQVKIEIADNGAGVPEDALEKLFDPFYRVESDRARQSGGTGLGLAIVKTCVEACQGKVAASNRIPQGLAVTISLKN
ncbi:MAG: HAMP domain-containing histidine kinase [Acidobacteriota bacterium]|nr:HAMP domain-containing histidine kinase [Acidobacteriota bacterium]